MKIAVVAGGWHFPSQFFEALAAQAEGVDLFCIAHRSPNLPIVREEKVETLANAPGPLGALDRMLYLRPVTVDKLCELGWKYEEAPNTCGDWEFLNQWLEKHDYREYDAILSCHDDTFIRRVDLFDEIRRLCELRDWLICANGHYPQAPDAYVRGSFEVFRPQLLDLLGGRIDLGPVNLTREGKTDTPAGLEAISEWNSTAVPLRRFMASRGYIGAVRYLSYFYRVSRWAIEGERGFLHYMDGVPWSFEAGCREFGVIESEVAA